MRKVSKNRADDDVVSSTNGSLMNDDQMETERNTDENEKDQNSIGDVSSETNNEQSSDISKETKKGRLSKSKSKNRKSGKEKSVFEEEEYEVEKIIDSKKIKGKLHYLIRWKGYSAGNDTWEPENTLSCPDLIMKYNDEKENSKDKDGESIKKANKRKAKKGKDNKIAGKRPKTSWDDKDDENAEYEVDRIMEVHHKKNGGREFLIHWKGWSSKFDSWEPESNLNCPELIKKFMDKVSNARSLDSRNLRVAPEATNRFTLQAPTTGRRLSKRRGQRQRVRYDNAE